MNEEKNQEQAAGAPRPTDPERAEPRPVPPVGCEGELTGGHPCHRTATVMYDSRAFCEPHWAVANLESRNEQWNRALDTAEGWLRDARESGHVELIRLAENAVADINRHTNELIDAALDVRTILGDHN